MHSSRPQARGGLQGGGLDPEASGPCWAVQVKTQPWGHGVIISGKKLALAGARRAEGAGDVAQLVACLPSVHRALALIPSPTEVEHGSCNPRTWRLRPVWAAGDPENQTIKPGAALCRRQASHRATQTCSGLFCPTGFLGSARPSPSPSRCKGIPLDLTLSPEGQRTYPRTDPRVGSTLT